MDDNYFEKFPGETNRVSSEAEIRAEKWETAMNRDDVPPFAGDFPVSTEPAGEVTPSINPEEQGNNSLMDAAAIINYGLNTAAKQYGVETVVQKIKNFNVSGSENPIQDLFSYLGVENPAETNDISLKGAAAKPEETDFYQNSEVAPTTKQRTPEGAIKAIEDMKELISEVEGADPRYEELRQNAKAAGKGYFEYAVGSSVDRGLTDLFNALAAEPKNEGSANAENSENNSQNNSRTNSQEVSI